MSDQLGLYYQSTYFNKYLDQGDLYMARNVLAETLVTSTPDDFHFFTSQAMAQSARLGTPEIYWQGDDLMVDDGWFTDSKLMTVKDKTNDEILATAKGNGDVETLGRGVNNYLASEGNVWSAMAIVHQNTLEMPEERRDAVIARAVEINQILRKTDVNLPEIEFEDTNKNGKAEFREVKY